MGKAVLKYILLLLLAFIYLLRENFFGFHE